MALKQAYILIGNSSSDRQPVEMSKYPCDVSMWRYMDHKTGSTVFGLSEVCRSRTARDQPRENCNSQCVKVQGKREEFRLHCQ